MRKRRRVGKQFPLFTIQRAALFPFNKEMHSLVRYTDLLNFTITDIYASKYSMMVGSSTTKIMNDPNVLNHCIKNVDQIDWSQFDTLILGHMDEWAEASNHMDTKKELICAAIKNKKNIFAFDDLSDIDIPESETVYYPRIWPEDIPQKFCFGKLYKISKPVLGVFGTSSQQGKFTLQLLIRKKLCDMGYHVGHLGTEPSALLYGCDDVFPMGYNSSVYIHDYDFVRCLNFKMNQISRNNKEIIIVGSQSGTVMYNNSNLLFYPLQQYNFLLGTQPDCCVLCVNPFDEIEYIQRTIAFIEASVACRMIAFVVFPRTLANNWAGIYGRKKDLSYDEYLIFKHSLTDQFHIPVYLLGDNTDMEQMIQTIISFFSN